MIIPIRKLAALTMTLAFLSLDPVIAAAASASESSAPHSESPALHAVVPAAALFPLTSVRLLNSPFTPAVKANREYMLALDPDRLLAPFRREAGLVPRKPSYGNWESDGLDGHIAGHYLSALADMIASGDDTKDGELRRRLDYMIDELALCQDANGDGYIGGVPGSRELWKAVAAGHPDAVFGKWVPWYNLHKTFAGLRDAYLVAGNVKAHGMLIRFGDWANTVTARLSDEQMQQMLGQEQGGMNEVLADIYAITHEEKYLTLARRFSHRAVLDPLEHKEDHLTGLHADSEGDRPRTHCHAHRRQRRRHRGALLLGDRDRPPLRRVRWQQRLRALQRSEGFQGPARAPRGSRNLQHLQHAAPDRAAFRGSAEGSLR